MTSTNERIIIRRHYFKEKRRPSFHLIVDGCNGPIRFCEQYLNNVDTEDGAISIHDTQSCRTVQQATTNNSRRQTRKQKKSISGNSIIKNKKDKAEAVSVSAVSPAPPPQRLNVIPLFHRIAENVNSPFQYLTVIFDGVSRTKRPATHHQHSPFPLTTGNTSSSVVVVGDNSSTTTTKKSIPMVVVDTTTVIQKKWNISKRMSVEITGLYDEADNVIVQTVQQWRQIMWNGSTQQQQQQQQETKNSSQKKDSAKNSTTSLPQQDFDKLPILSSNQVTESRSDEKDSHSDDDDHEDEDGTISCVKIVLVRRSDQGSGKARTILKPLLLLRPESVLCLFAQGLGSTQLHQDANDTLSSKRLYHPRVGKNVIDYIQEVGYDYYINNDNHHHCRSNNYNEDNDDDLDPKLLCIPVVVTDDIFLRQRVVDHHGYVMTFYQFWKLLSEAY